MHFSVDSNEAGWNSGRTEVGGNLGYKNRPKEGYFPSAPFVLWQMLDTIWY